MHGEDGGVLSAVDGHGGHGDSRGHLEDGEGGVKAFEGAALDGYADDGQGCLGGDDTRQGGGHAGTGNDDTYAAGGGIAGEVGDLGGGAVGRKGVDFEGDFHLLKEFAGFLHDGEVGGGAHDDADLWFHIKIDAVLILLTGWVG